MSLKVADRVQELTNAAGTGSIALQGAVPGYRTFARAATDGHLDNGSTVPYYITDGTEWETGTGTVSSGSPWSLSRDEVTASSNGGAVINVTAGMHVAIDTTSKFFEAFSTGPVSKEKRYSQSGIYSYCGTAPTGSSDASAVWTIHRLTIGATVVNQVATTVAWTDRATATYA